MKDVGISLIKDVQNFIEKNYKTPLKDSSKKTQINVEVYHFNELKNKIL